MSHVNNTTPSTEPETAPASCKNGCGFFGTPQNLGYCSVCYTKIAKKNTEEKKVSPSIETIPSVPKEDLSTQISSETISQEEQKDKTRCFSCNKKVGLVGIPCRCTYIFCPKHRQAEAHSCRFDYKTTARDRLTKANPVVVADKITKV